MRRFIGFVHVIGLPRLTLAASVAAVTVGGFVFNNAVRRSEACLSAMLVRRTGLSDAVCTADSALYTITGRLVGHSVTAGCSFVLLLPPFAALCCFLLLVRRVPVHRPLLAFAGAGLIVLASNQLRMLAIVSGMRVFGPERGYGMTHVLVGTVLSIFGTGTAGLFLVMVLSRRAVLARHRWKGAQHGQR